MVATLSKPETATADSWRRQVAGLVLVALVLTTAGVYQQVGQFEFTNYDDEHYISKNPIVSHGLSVEGIGWALTTTYFSYWHPLTWLSHMLDCELFGLEAGLHHYVSLVWHVLNTVLVWWVLMRLTGSVERSLFVAACFALHPLHVESVAWLAERKDLVSTFFWLLTTAVYAQYARTGSQLQYGLALASFAAGLMAKPMVVTLPVVLLLLDYWPLRRWPPGELQTSGLTVSAAVRAGWPLVREKLPFFGLAAGSAAITVLGVKASGSLLSLQQVPLSLRLANVPISYVRYLAKTFWPVDLAVLYPMPPRWAWPWVLGSTVAVGLITALAVSGWRRAPYLLWGWSWFVVTLLPTINLLPVGYQAIADRYTYVPLIGIFVAVSWAAVELTARWRWLVGLRRAAAVAVAFALALVSRQQVQHWRDSVSLWSQALRATGDNPIAHYNLGHALAQLGHTTQAIEHYREAIRLKPDYLDAHLNLGGLHLAAGNAAEATNCFRAALRIRPGYDKAHNNLGSALLLLGDLAAATNHFTQALQHNPNNVKARFNLGVALIWCGQYLAAADQLSAAARLMPVDPQIHWMLGRALVAAGQVNQGLGSYRQALQLDPYYAQAMAWLGLTLIELGQSTNGVGWLQRAVRAHSGLADAQAFLALALRAQGQSKAALSHWHEALRLPTDDPEVLGITAWALATCPDPQFRNGPAALARAQRACTLTGQVQPRWLLALAAAQAETANFQAAQATAQQARTLASNLQRPDLVALCDQLLARFKVTSPYRDPALAPDVAPEP